MEEQNETITPAPSVPEISFEEQLQKIEEVPPKKKRGRPKKTKLEE